MNKYCYKCKTMKNEKDFFKRRDKKAQNYSYCKMCYSILSIQRKRKFKQICLEYLGGKCHQCGYNKCPAALEFHHIDPSKKDFSISKFQKLLWEKHKDIITTELNKCIILCANCHRETHYDKYSNLEEYVPFKKQKVYKTCKACNNKFSSANKTFCSYQCYMLNNRKVERPTKDELQKLIQEYSFVKIGKMYNVSDNAIRKWCKSYSIKK